MAIWQFECKIIPLRENINNLNYSEIISWRGFTLKYNIDFLEREKSWSNEIIQYGKLDETCIEFVYENGVLQEVECRLDLRTLTKHNFMKILEYVQRIGACFLVAGNVYLPNEENMVEVMRQSKANQYCKNPLEYIGTLIYKDGEIQ